MLNRCGIWSLKNWLICNLSFQVVLQKSTDILPGTKVRSGEGMLRCCPVSWYLTATLAVTIRAWIISETWRPRKLLPTEWYREHFCSAALTWASSSVVEGAARAEKWDESKPHSMGLDVHHGAGLNQRHSSWDLNYQKHCIDQATSQELCSRSWPMRSWRLLHSGSLQSICPLKDPVLVSCPRYSDLRSLQSLLPPWNSSRMASSLKLSLLSVPVTFIHIYSLSPPGKLQGLKQRTGSRELAFSFTRRIYLPFSSPSDQILPSSNPTVRASLRKNQASPSGKFHWAKRELFVSRCFLKKKHLWLKRSSQSICLALPVWGFKAIKQMDFFRQVITC